MNTSTIEARRSPGKRLGIFALGLAVACAGMFGLASSKAEASPTSDNFSMRLNDGLINLGAAFNGQRILPAPAKLGDTDTVLPNWWDIVDSAVAASGDPTAVGSCASPVAAQPVPNTTPNPLFPCGTNPSFGMIQTGPAIAGLGITASSWNPSTGAISLPRVAPSVPNTTPWAEPFNLDVRFPIMVIPSPLTGGPIPITLAATGAVEGTYSSTYNAPTATAGPSVTFGDGALTLKPAAGSSFEARVLVGLGIESVWDVDPTKRISPQPFTYCKVPLPGLELSTTSGAAGSKGFPATPFLSGLEGAGSLQGTYKVEADSTPVTQQDPSMNDLMKAEAAEALKQCDNVDLVSKGDGGLWLGNRAEVPACENGQIGNYPDCADPEARISKIAITGKNKVKRGKKVTLRVKVTNSGTADKKVKVGIFTNKSGTVKAPGSVTVNAPAGSTGSKKVTVRGKKKGKVTISASIGERTGKRTITVR